MARLLILLLLALPIAPAATAWAEEAEPEEPERLYPPGETTVELEGRKVVLFVPETLPTSPELSLVVNLHGFRAQPEGMAYLMEPFVEHGFVICAPKSQGDGWASADLAAVRRIVHRLLTELPIHPRRIHVTGFSNGGWNLAPLAFDESLRPVSALWVGSGYRGARVPPWAAEGIAAMALVGGSDANLSAARQTLPKLYGRVRSVEVRIEDGLGHAWPHQQLDYVRWWMRAAEGHYVPGDDRNFAWGDNLDKALHEARRRSSGSGVLLYVWSAEDAGGELGPKVQNRLLMEPRVRHLGRQLVPVKLRFEDHPSRLGQLGVADTPALVLFDRKGKVSRVLQRKIQLRRLIPALQAVAPRPKLPAWARGL